jgi:hypothetical protein
MAINEKAIFLKWKMNGLLKLLHSNKERAQKEKEKKPK